MAVKMILHDGPLDGEQQLVENLSTTPGYEMQFNIPNYQTFDASGNNVTGMGLVAVYAYQGPGPAPNPPAGDTWTASMIYEFTGEFFIPAPPPLYPPGGGPPILPVPPAVFLSAGTSMTINANDPSAGVQMMGEGDMVIEATSNSVGYATIALVGETSMQVFSLPWQNVVTMSASSGMTITPN